MAAVVLGAAAVAAAVEAAAATVEEEVAAVAAADAVTKALQSEKYPGRRSKKRALPGFQLPPFFASLDAIV